MRLTHLANFISFEIWFFLVGLSSIVFFSILAGRINTRKLLVEKNQSCIPSWQKTQLLVATIIGSIYYLVLVRHSLDAFHACLQLENPNLCQLQLPNLSEEMLLILGGSNLLFLGSKFSSLFLQRKTSSVIQIQDRGQ